MATLNLGAEYANIHSPHFNPTVKKTGKAAHEDDNLYGSLYQWQRASDGHEFKNPETIPKLADTWTNPGIDVAGKFITLNDGNWVENGENATGLDLLLWRAEGDNNPCPSGYHVPTMEEWDHFINAVGSDNKMMTQNKLPNLAAAGARSYYDASLSDRDFAGAYWSSSDYKDTNDYNVAYAMRFYDGYGGVFGYNYRANGLSVRCIKDN